jgi:uncharacterized phage protein (TIGR02216 family)
MRSMVEGRLPSGAPFGAGAPPPLAFGERSPSPLRGEEFSAAAARLAGLAGVAFGWSPAAFWGATPAELAALVRAVAGESVAPPDAAAIARLKEAFPDG